MACLTSTGLPCRALFVIGKADEMQIGLTAQERQQLEGSSLPDLVAAFRAASTTFSRGSSAYRGVSFRSRTGKYVARIQGLGSKPISLGYWDSEDDAARAYDAAALARHGRYVLISKAAVATKCCGYVLQHLVKCFAQ